MNNIEFILNNDLSRLKFEINSLELMEEGVARILTNMCYSFEVHMYSNPIILGPQYGLIYNVVP